MATPIHRQRLAELQRRPTTGVPFSDLPAVERLAVMNKWHQLLARWAKHGRLPGWRRGLLAAVARRVVLYPLTSRQARSMLAKRGALAKQKIARRHGTDPWAAARKTLAAKRAREHERREAARPVPIGLYDPVFRRPPEVSLAAAPQSSPISDALAARKRTIDLAYGLPVEHAPDERMWPKS